MDKMYQLLEELGEAMDSASEGIDEKCNFALHSKFVKIRAIAEAMTAESLHAEFNARKASFDAVMHDSRLNDSRTFKLL